MSTVRGYYRTKNALITPQLPCYASVNTVGAMKFRFIQSELFFLLTRKPRRDLRGHVPRNPAKTSNVLNAFHARNGLSRVTSFTLTTPFSASCFSCHSRALIGS